MFTLKRKKTSKKRETPTPSNTRKIFKDYIITGVRIKVCFYSNENVSKIITAFNKLENLISKAIFILRWKFPVKEIKDNLHHNTNILY